MTEAEWLACDDPYRLLEALPAPVSDRQWRLFACACCRRVWSMLHDPNCRRAVEVAERFADGDASPSTHADAGAAAWRTWTQWPRIDNYGVKAVGAAAWVAQPGVGPAEAATVLRYTLAAECRMEPDEAKRDRCDLVRDLFGNPFRAAPLTDQPPTPAVVAFAQSVYDDRDFDRLPLLADGLADAGCHNADLLNHCRAPGPHALGCWVLDALLGKG